MPIYEYQCSGKCRKKFEYMQSMSEPRRTKCEKCGGKLEKLISAAGFVLKGGGWYKDLYASQKPGASGSGGDGESPGATSSAEKGDKGDKGAKSDKAESKPESKAEKTEAKTPKVESKPERASSSSKKAKRK